MKKENEIKISEVYFMRVNLQTWLCVFLSSTQTIISECIKTNINYLFPNKVLETFIAEEQRIMNILVNKIKI